ncbi:MAG TPA: hypothetical protein VFF79_02840 [Conexibacter sp.]|jgi:hypothetical protein|nr:hypothetical protein [Conexibacter sp.]
MSAEPARPRAGFRAVLGVGLFVVLRSAVGPAVIGAVAGIVYRLDDNRIGLALLVALVAALHAGGAAGAVLLARGRPAEPAGSAGTIPA